MKPKLRDYQKEYIDGIREQFKRGRRKVILCAPTGSGKTYLFSYMIASALNNGNSCLVFTHRQELLTQAYGSFSKFGIKPKEIKAGLYPNLDYNCHVAMIETFYRRIETDEEYLNFLNTRDLIVIDEAHFSHFDKVLKRITNPNVFVIGATATPFRKGKNIDSLEYYYQGIVNEYDTPELIEDGYLVPAESYGIEIDMSGIKQSGDDYRMEEYYESNKTYLGVIDNYKRIAENEKTILFSSNVQSSKTICEEFIKEGYNARHVDGTTPRKERKAIFEWFDKTDNAILCNCGIATTGFDQPDIKCVILYRATTSLPLFMQMCGRGSRTFEGKESFKILDFGNNIQRFGFWENPREWTIKKVEPKNKDAVAPTKQCEKCNAINYASARLCIMCGEPFPKTEETEEVILQKLENPLKFSDIKKEMREGVTFKRLEDIRILNDYKQSWVWYQIPKKYLKEYAEFKGYKQSWAYWQINSEGKRNNDIKIIL